MYETKWDEVGAAAGLGALNLGPLKERLHRQVIDTLDLAVVAKLDNNLLKVELTKLVQEMLEKESVPLSMKERESLIADIEHEVMGLGPLEPLVQDQTVNDILVNRADQIYVERAGKLELTDVKFRDEAHLRKIIEKIVSAVGRRIDESSPMVDARLLDGSRVNAIIPPLALNGSSISIRKFSKDKLQISDLVNKRSLTPEIAELLRGIVEARLNILISGGTGCGKTTILNILSGFIPSDERIVTIEDSAELQLRQEHVVRLETRPPNVEGRGEVSQRELVKNCLRMRPDRIVMGEVRSGECLDMLQAMNTGHDGSLTTIHANTPRDCLTRVETLVAMAGLNLATKALRHYISSAIDVILQMTRLSDGSRKMTSLSEIVGMEGETITLQEIFLFQQTGLDEERKVHGQFRATGVRPKFVERFKALGITCDPSIFDPEKIYEV
ncbi:CpaF family protein [Candidatus Nitrospira allomarina]|uniref:CpaF family protein n=1 Tax=Candidatus Nitrospira allomarina TaxID=3020900 RepID=A0AA96GGQ3_9BACT|nr:CpaF family protein [Candidatus Nitrospira allomarina]WNM59780.1 CpaF family protein [Candidatus Nitrospira allomarina]